MPYGWQFKGEDVSIAAARGAALNCFGLLSRGNDFIYATRVQTSTADFIIEQLDKLSWQIAKHTVVVLDNARVHQNGKVKAIQSIWARRGLFIFFLPPYSPHLNIIERLWKELKARWLRPQDYVDKEQLFYSLNLILNAIGKDLTIKFKLIMTKYLPRNIHTSNMVNYIMQVVACTAKASFFQSCSCRTHICYTSKMYC